MIVINERKNVLTPTINEKIGFFINVMCIMKAADGAMINARSFSKIIKVIKPNVIEKKIIIMV